MKENGRPLEKKKIKQYIIQPDRLKHKTGVKDFLNKKPKQKDTED